MAFWFYNTTSLLFLEMHLEICQDTYTEMLEICFKKLQQMKVKEKRINETDVAKP